MERWWEALLVGEEKIDLAKIDCSRNLDELGAAEQMKLEELIWNHQRKLIEKPTAEEIVCFSYIYICSRFIYLMKINL